MATRADSFPSDGGFGTAAPLTADTEMIQKRNKTRGLMNEKDIDRILLELDVATLRVITLAGWFSELTQGCSPYLGGTTPAPIFPSFFPSCPFQ